MGSYWMAQACGAGDERTAGASSTSAACWARPRPGCPQAAYASSKAAIIGLTRDLAQQWTGRKGIRVNALAPGFFPSEMTDQYPDGYMEQMMLRVPAGRPGRAEELVAALVFLASDAASYVTGVRPAGRRRRAHHLKPRAGRAARDGARACCGRRGAEDVIPERCADAVAALVVLEVVAHVQLAQAPAQPRLGPVVVHVVMQHVVAQVSAQEARAEGQERRAAEHQVEAVDEQRGQRDAQRRRHDQPHRVVGMVVVHAVDDPVQPGADARPRARSGRRSGAASTRSASRTGSRPAATPR